MKTIEGFINYKVLGHENEFIFTINNKHPQASFSEQIEIFISDNFKIEKNNFEEVLITTPDGETYLADQIIRTSKDQNPIFSWFDGHTFKDVVLNWI